MLVVENNSVYEIDEECLKRRSVPEECEVYKKIVREREVAKNKEKTKNQSKRQKTTQTVKSGWFTGQGNFRFPIDICLRSAEAVSVTTSATAEKK